MRRFVRKPDWRGLSLLGVGILVIALDQYTKFLVRKHLALNVSWNPIPWLDPIVTFTRTENSGAAFGILPGLSVIFAIVAIVVVIGFALFYRKLASSSWLLRLAVGVQWGGAAGNLVDRLRFGGLVTDFIDFRWFPVFNVADSSIVVGTILLAVYI
ncbi:MAG: signal peptidase II, partial [Chloroflexi bacterium RBG_13_56_8]